MMSTQPPKATEGPTRDPLLHSERTQGFTADPDYWKGELFVYVGRNQNLKDLKDPTRGGRQETRSQKLQSLVIHSRFPSLIALCFETDVLGLAETLDPEPCLRVREESTPPWFANPEPQTLHIYIYIYIYIYVYICIYIYIYIFM